jgi:hypothetical protein
VILAVHQRATAPERVDTTERSCRYSLRADLEALIELSTRGEPRAAPALDDQGRSNRCLPSHASGQDAEREERIVWLA